MWSRNAGIVGIGLFLTLAVALLAVVMVAPVAAQDVPSTADVIPPHLDGVQPESCVTCHKDAGAEHQASYDEFYQDGVIQVTDLAYSYSAPDTSIVTFNMTKDGDPFDASKADSLGIYFVPYADSKFQFEPAAERLSLKGDLTYDGAGGNTSTLAGEAPDVSDVSGLIVVYGRDEDLGSLPARIRQTRYPFAAILETGDGVDYVSSANNAGCVKCHTDPYLKHGYIYAQVDHDPGTDFYTCKACHLDNGEGGHFEWQLLVDDPALAAAVLAEEVELTPEQEAQYAYPTTLMNDVHMSHAMEFPYPQSMANCATCHEGKLDTVLSDDNFVLSTCKSCHPMTGSEEYGTAESSIETMLLADGHEDLDLAADACNDCHRVGKKAEGLSEIHTGYDKVIYAAEGLKYSDAISVTIDSASFDGSNLNIAFSAGESPDLDGLDTAAITPTVMVGLYGWDTKDFIIGAHERLFDDNDDGEISRASGDQRALEYDVGEEHPRFATVSAGDGSWEVVADMSAWTDMIDDGSVKRVEIAVMPTLENADGLQLAVNAPSRTFDLGANDFDDDFYSPIAKVVDGCNDCHDALATTFHSPDRGGSIVVCRMCHITKSGGSHLEMQSRSLDSYIHATHSFQPYDFDEIDFADPVEALHYEHHIGFPYPTHGVTNCESCHLEDQYDVPDQTMSLPGLLSASASNETIDRSIPDVPSYITGPASRACGGCHRAALINEDEASELISFNQHTKQGGYLIEAGADNQDSQGQLMTAIEEVMAIFE
jgi:OmcA/MtrC family decaheme c-type cytochrome